MLEYLRMTLVSAVIGTFARIYMLRVDYRQYPSYPQGYLVHITLGMIAALLGAVVIPALIAKEYTAVTFLAVATQQFREIRDMERKSLVNIENTELVPRGSAYIEDIAKTFESRNYLAVLTALCSSVIFYLTKSIVITAILGVLIIAVLSYFTKRKKIGEIVVVNPAKIHFEVSMLCVENMKLVNIGHPDLRKIYEEMALAVTIEPIDDDARATLANIGQRQAISHDTASILGVKRDTDDAQMIPLSKIDTSTGMVVFVIVPMEKDIESLTEAIRRVPILEGSRRRPLKSLAGKRAAD